MRTKGWDATLADQCCCDSLSWTRITALLSHSIAIINSHVAEGCSPSSAPPLSPQPLADALAAPGDGPCAAALPGHHLQEPHVSAGTWLGGALLPPAPADRCSQCWCSQQDRPQRPKPSAAPCAVGLQAAQGQGGAPWLMSAPPCHLWPPRPFMHNQYLPGGPSPEPRDEEMPELAPFPSMVEAPLSSSTRW